MAKFEVAVMTADEMVGEDITVDAADEAGARLAALDYFDNVSHDDLPIKSEADLMSQMGVKIVCVTAL